MGASSRSFKHAVASLIVTVGLSLPAFAQQDGRLADLYDQLRQADADGYAWIEEQIWEEWSKSGSPAMDLLLRRGKDALESGDLEAAIEHLTALIDHAPDFPEAYNARATAYYLDGAFGPALDDIAMTLKLEPDHFAAMTGLAIIFEEIDRPEQALAAYREVAKRHPNEPNVAEAIARLETAIAGQNI